MNLLMQVPPTPTPFPTISPTLMPFNIPQQTLWSFAPDAVQAWNSLGMRAAGGNGVGATWTEIFQGIMLLALVVFGIWMIITFLRGLMKERAAAAEDADE